MALVAPHEVIHGAHECHRCKGRDYEVDRYGLPPGIEPPDLAGCDCAKKEPEDADGD